MPIYRIDATASETKENYRLVDAANPAQALKHVAGKLFKVSKPLGPQDIARAFVDDGITVVEKAANE